jgi:hypothetical protein
MGVIYGFSAPSRDREGPPRSSGCGLDVERAVLFLEAQASWLRRGLARAADPVAVGVVLGSHDACHESWLALIAHADQVSRDASQVLASLYGLHGRIVGTLERGTDLRLDAVVADQVRSLLGTRLDELTAEAVTTLRQLGVPASTVGA